MTCKKETAQGIVFDTIGTALQDVAAAAVVYEKAESANKGTWFEFSK